MRIDRFRNELDEYFFDIALPVAIAMTNPENSVTFRELNPAIGAEFEICGLFCRSIEQMTRIIRIEDMDLLVLGPFVIFRRHLSVARDHPNPSLFINIHSGWRGNVLMFGDQ